MKKTAVLLLLVIFIITVFTFCKQDATDESEPFSVYTEIADGVFFERWSATEHSIFFAKRTDSTERKYIIKDQLIFRFGYNDGYLAYHWNEISQDVSKDDDVRVINSVEYAIIKDYITVYNVESEEYYDFFNQDEFNEYCRKNDLYFDWHFSHGNSLNTVARSEKNTVWEIADFTSESLTGFVLKDGKVVYEGFISDVTHDDDFVCFRLQVPDKSLLEFRDLDLDNLSIPFVEPIGKYMTAPFYLAYEDIYYDKYILIDTTTDEVVQFSDKAEVKKVLEDKK